MVGEIELPSRGVDFDPGMLDCRQSEHDLSGMATNRGSPTVAGRASRYQPAVPSVASGHTRLGWAPSRNLFGTSIAVVVIAVVPLVAALIFLASTLSLPAPKLLGIEPLG